MRTVFRSHDEVCHVWAQGTQSQGRGGRIFFRDGRIFSYGEHFCIARLLPSGVVLFTNRDYSISTSQHKQKVRHAVSHRRIVHCWDPGKGVWSNKDHAERGIKCALEEAVTQRKVLPKTRVESKLHALRIAQEFNEYLSVLPEAERSTCQPFDLQPLEVSEEDRALLMNYEATLSTKREARWERDAEKRKAIMARAALELPVKIAEWRSHIYDHNFGYSTQLPTMLRLSKDKTEVETSRGARIPVSHAKRLWPLIENARAVGKELVRDVRLGHYTLSRINADGSIVVGCHNIPYSEIENIARELGLVNQGEPA